MLLRALLYLISKGESRVRFLGVSGVNEVQRNIIEYYSLTVTGDRAWEPNELIHCSWITNGSHGSHGSTILKSEIDEKGEKVKQDVMCYLGSGSKSN